MEPALSSEVLAFDGFVLDLGRCCLRAPEGHDVALRPKAFDLLLVLARSAGTLLSKDQLLDAVWGEIHVTEDSLVQAIREVRRAIGDPAGRKLRTVPRRGYLLDLEVQRRTGLAWPGQELGGFVALPNARPSVAVLPFRSEGPDAAPDYVADGLVEEVTTALSRFLWLVVVANSSAAVAAAGSRTGGQPEIGRALGVRYLVEGSVREVAGRLRVNARLIEAAQSRQVWAEHFDAPAEDPFAMQDRVTAAIAAALEPRILRAEVERVTRRPTADPGAYDLYLRALPPYFVRTAASNAEAVRLLEQALESDPHFHLARALLARCTASAVWLGGDPDHLGGTRRALALAREALAADRTDPQILALCGHLLAIGGGEHEEAGALLDLALRMNPNSADAWRLGAWVSVWAGESETALARLAQAERLDPLSPLQADVHSARAAALFFARRFADAAAAARRSLASAPGATAPRRYLAAALAHLGRGEDARAAAAELVSRQPSSSVRRSRDINPYRHPWMTELFLDGLRRAGLPEE